jgi:hypothetical protein
VVHRDHKILDFGFGNANIFSYFMLCYAVYYYQLTALLAAYERQQVLDIEI